MTHRRGRHAGEKGATLLMLSIIVFVLLTGSTLLASAQITHSNRIMAEYGVLQAKHAAEAGVFASLAKHASDADVLADGETRVTYEATMPEAPPYWIESIGSVTIGGQIYRASVRALLEDGRITEWNFD